MRGLLIVILMLVHYAGAFAQDDLHRMEAAEIGLNRIAAVSGLRSGANFFSDDAVIFYPAAINAKTLFANQTGPIYPLRRTAVFADIATNGMLGYTTGSWQRYPGATVAPVRYGDYVTIWQKGSDGNFRASLDISITYDEPRAYRSERPNAFVPRKGDMNKRRWSVADPSMNFLKAGMGNGSLAEAYTKFAAEDIRLLRDGDLPIVGKKRVVSVSRQYKSLGFPTKVASLESADMAYTWNTCQFSNGNEGIENGNCLQIWKLQNKKWRIALSVFSRMPNITPPELKSVKKKVKAEIKE